MVVTSFLANASSHSLLSRSGYPCRHLSATATRYEIDEIPGSSREDLLALEEEDIILHHAIIPKLVIFDMDSTLINEECIDLLASYAGVEAQVSDITRRAMNGELDFEASLRARVALLSGLPVDAIEAVKGRITFAQGAHGLCRALRKLGVEMVLASGGFMPLAIYVATELGIRQHRVFANTLTSKDGKLTGTLEGTIVDAKRKQSILERVRSEIGCRDDQTVAIGDGANDLLMLKAAGLGIAIHAKEMVQRAAPARIRFGDLSHVLYVFGYHEDAISDLCI